MRDPAAGFARPGRATAGVAIAALAIILVACQASPAPTSGSGGPTASIAPSGTVMPSLIPTVEPTPSPWTGLEWSDGVPGINEAYGKASIADILPWGDGYVGAGYLLEKDGGFFSAFFASADGLHWTKTWQGTDDWAGVRNPGELVPSQLLPVASGLIAVSHNVFSAPSFWRSADGASWVPIDSAVPDVIPGGTLKSIAAGRAGLIAVGAQGSMCCGHPQGTAIITHSADGLSWERLFAQPAAFDNAYITDVATYPGGYVVVGRVGQQDASSGTESGIGKPAAWTSPDGMTWTAAEVDGAQAAGATLTAVIVSADGLFAVGRQADTSPALGGQGPLSGWASTDGQTWRLVGQLATDLPDATVFAGDGTHMLMFGRASCKTTALEAWVSAKGVTWTRLAFSGSTAIPDLLLRSARTMAPRAGTPAG